MRGGRGGPPMPMGRGGPAPQRGYPPPQANGGYGRGGFEGTRSDEVYILRTY